MSDEPESRLARKLSLLGVDTIELVDVEASEGEKWIRKARFDALLTDIKRVYELSGGCYSSSAVVLELGAIIARYRGTE